MMKTYVWFIPFLILCIGCEKEKTKPQWKSINAELTTLYTIGEADSSYYFAHPDYTATTADNNVVIADRGLNKLMVFDQDGKYLHDIGERGPGPAQFRDIMGMWVDNNGRIIVFDRDAQTFKQFTASGEYKGSHVNRGSNIGTGTKGEYISNHLLLLYRSPMSQNSQNYLFHLYSIDYDSILSESLAAQNLDGYTEMMILQLGLASKAGSYLVMGKTILFAPRLYNGYIYMYRLTSNNYSIKFVKKIVGLVYKDPLSEISKDSDYYDVRLSDPQRGEHKFYLHNQTLGLYQLKDGRIVHFTYIENEERTARTFGAEIYTSQMEPIGYAEFYTKKFEDVV